MKFITVREFRTRPAEIWKELPEEQEMVITNNGKPIALLTPLTESNIEETLKSIRRARAVNAVNKMRQISAVNRNNKIKDAEINSIISEIRKNR